ncbi:MAG: type VI secretion system tip protein VgrG, partial [Bryobacteraceae bacterium]|nr:type VI secretion system tip protein VgrG [Bryobacteraceae bacterium]
YYEAPGEYWEPAEITALAGRIAEEYKAHTAEYSGQASCRGICVGGKFSMQDPLGGLAAGMAGNYLVTSVTITAQNDEFISGSASKGPMVSTSFTVVPAMQNYRPPRVTPKPVVVGPHTATVVGPAGDEIHVDKYGRVKIHFHWDRQGEFKETDSCWVRVSQGMAGNLWGMMFLPRIGHEVIVEFMDGDPDRPMITGRVYNASQMPPYDLPSMMTVSTIKTLSSKGGKGFHEIRFDDKAGSEMMFVHAQKDFDRRVLKEMKTFVGDSRSDTIKKDLKQKIDGDVGQTVGGAVSIKTGKDYGIDVGAKYMLKITGNTSVKTDAALAMKSGGNTSVDSGGAMFLKAATGLVLECSAGITLKCGGNSVVLDSAGVTIKGSMVTIDGSMVKIASGPGSPPSAGAAGSLDSPAAPAEPVEPVKADPGSMVEYQQEAVKRETIEIDPAKGTPGKKNEKKEEKEETKWLEIEVIDSDGEPVKSEKVKVTFTGGKVVSKSTDGSGKVRIDDIKDADGEAMVELTERVDPEYDKVAEVESGEDTKALGDPEPKPAPVVPAEDVYEEADPDVLDEEGAGEGAPA